MLIASMANTLKNVFQSNILLQLLFQTGNRTLISVHLINPHLHNYFHVNALFIALRINLL